MGSIISCALHSFRRLQTREVVGEGINNGEKGELDCILIEMPTDIEFYEFVLF
jgi:hypothetical protein